MCLLPLWPLTTLRGGPSARTHLYSYVQLVYLQINLQQQNNITHHTTKHKTTPPLRRRRSANRVAPDATPPTRGQARLVLAALVLRHCRERAPKNDGTMWTDGRHFAHRRQRGALRPSRDGAPSEGSRGRRRARSAPRGRSGRRTYLLAQLAVEQHTATQLPVT